MRKKEEKFFINLYSKLKIEKSSLKPISEAYIEGDEIAVSISCITYNHEKWIARALDSFLMQKVNFNVEIIIHDDASTDNTTNIIREYEKKYPNIIKVIYEEENQYSKQNGIIAVKMRNITHGKYVARCEGDDYWIEPYKLYLQFNALESSEESHFCVHRVRLVDTMDRTNNKLLPKQNYGDRIFNDKEFINLLTGYRFQTSSYFFRCSDYFEYIDNKPQFAKQMPTGDEAMVRYYGSRGSTIYFDNIMSTYEMFLEGSWSFRHIEKSDEEKRNHEIRFCLAVMEFNKWTNYKYMNNDILETKILLLNEQYVEILNNKKYRNSLKNINIRVYYSVWLKVNHPQLYSFLKKVKNNLLKK